MSSYTSINGQMRLQTRQWWFNQISRGAREVIGVYNDGFHLYIHRGFPGQFIVPPTKLEHFPFNIIVKRFDSFEIIHGGHAQLTIQGISYGCANVFFRSRFQILRISIQPCHMAYVTLCNDVLESRFIGLGLPRTVLGEVLPC